MCHSRDFPSGVVFRILCSMAFGFSHCPLLEGIRIAAKRHAPLEDEPKAYALPSRISRMQMSGTLAAEKRSTSTGIRALDDAIGSCICYAPGERNVWRFRHTREQCTSHFAQKGTYRCRHVPFYVELLANQNPAFLPHGNPIPKPCEQIGIAARFAHHAHKLIERFTVGGGAQHRSNRAQAFNFRFA